MPAINPMSHKTAVVLFNLGGPDSLQTVRPFLYNLFSDPDIFRFPLAFITQRLFATLVSRRRAPEASQNYAAIGGKSPILENTRAQARALQQALGSDFDVVICMRYWHPMTAEVVAQLKQHEYQKIVLLPLYPQYSTTTTGSSYNEFRRQCQRQDYHPQMTLVEHWYDAEDYQHAIVQTLEAELAQFPQPQADAVELLFSAHGLPQKIVDAGDPYEQQIRATYETLIQQLDWPHTTLCYQSRVGPLQWLRPYIQDVLAQKAKAGAKQLLIYPIAFVSDHVETLYELGIEYAELAQQLGIEHYRVAPALNANPLLITALKKLVLEHKPT